LTEFVALYEQFVIHSGDATASELRRSATASCLSIGKRVRVLLPGDQTLEGRAVEIDDSGRLLIAVDGEQQFFAVAAGDIVHLRHN
jgi:BirA family biotin operon repressor/biotin-[acetyl-CoA-carboxylase] ligase